VIRLTVLGSCGTYPAAGRACSGYLLEAEVGGQTTRIWIDAGSGTLANLLRYTSLADLDAIWISHLHIDHTSDLLAANYAIRYGGHDPRTPPVPVYGPPGWAEHLGAFLKLRTSDAFELRGDAIEQAFEPHELHDGQRVKLGSLELTAIATAHSVETYAVRAAADDHLIAYSADSGPCDALGRLAADADLFVCEAAWPEKREGGHPTIHLTARLAGEWARQAGAHRLLLTHLRPEADLKDAVARARDAFGGEVGLAREGDVIQLGHGSTPGGTL